MSASQIEGLLNTVDQAEATVSAHILGKGEPEVKNKPKVSKTYDFHIRHEADNGVILQGKFTNKILNVQQLIAVGILRTKITNGLPFDSLDPLTQELSEAISHCQVSLIKKPEWAKNMAGLEEFDLVSKIYEEVNSHEARFRESRKNPEKREVKEG